MRRFVPFLVALLPALAGLVAIAAQVPSQTTADQPRGLIFGQVVDAYGYPVSGAIVSLDGGLRLIGTFTMQADQLSGGTRRTVTTANGNFLFAGLPAGGYSIVTTKPGYEPGGFGRLRPEGSLQTLHLGAGERRGTVSIRMWKVATVSGAVMDEAGEPVVGVSVLAMRRTYHTGRTRFEMISGEATTDDRGAYRIAGLTSGEYVVVLVSTRVTVPAPLVAAVADARLNPDQFASLPRVGGMPIGIRSTSPGQRLGDWVLQPAATQRRQPIAPGAVPGGPTLVYPTLFYPSTTSLDDAQVLTLASGDERSGVDLSAHVVPAATVSGVVHGPDGPMANVSIRLVPAYAETITAEGSYDSAISVSNHAGEFLLLGVPAGRYLLRAVSTNALLQGGAASRSPNARVRRLTADVPITVTGPDPVVQEVRLTGGFVIRGRYVFEGTTPPPEGRLLDGHSVMVQPLDGHMPDGSQAYLGDVEADGSFTTPELPRGRYVIRSGTSAPIRRAMETWIFRDVMAGTLDVAGSPLDLVEDVRDVRIRFTDQPTLISGVARTPQGTPDPDAAVLVISADEKDWTNFGSTPRRLRNVRASLDGSFRVAGLPPGDYIVAAIPEADAGDWHNPGVLSAAARSGTRVTLGDGQNARQDVVTRPLR